MVDNNVTPVSKANERQVGADHYKTGGLEHWDIVNLFQLDYFQGAITKYLFRWRKKDGVKDLRKAQHFMEKYLELAVLSEVFVEAAKEPSAYGPPVFAFTKGEVAPTGWVQYVFEGANADGYLYTCRQCGVKFYAPAQTNPHATHACHDIASSACEGDATGAYVQQG